MRTLKFYGASDDLFEVEDSKRTHTNEYNPGSIRLCEGTTGLIVTAMYDVADSGCWMIGISPIDDSPNRLMPNWSLRYYLHERGYSTVIELDVPDDIELVYLEFE